MIHVVQKTYHPATYRLNVVTISVVSNTHFAEKSSKLLNFQWIIVSRYCHFIIWDSNYMIRLFYYLHLVPPDTRIIRGCGWDDSNYKNRCYQKSGYGGRQEVCACSSDNCNGSNNMKSAPYAIIIPLLTFIIFRWHSIANNKQ